MTGKTVSILFLILAVGSAFMVSCQNSEEPAFTRLDIVIQDSNAGSRTIMPAAALMETRKYSVSGTGPAGKSFGPIISAETSISVDAVDVGSWTISAKALNAENNELSSGSGDFFIGRGQNNVTVVLDSMTGNGSLQLDLTWDEDITYLDDIRMDISVYDISGNEISSLSRNADIDDSDGITVLIPLIAGCHVVSVRVYDDDGSLDVGATDAVRIIAGTRSTGTLHLQASNPNPTGELTISFDNRVGVPMGFYLDYSPKIIAEGQNVTLIAQHGTLPSSIDTSSLTYQWYVDGVLFSSGTSSTCGIVALYGLHRYDVIVRSNVAGTMCGASLMLNVTE